MRVFVTGGAGFVGRPVIQELLNNGHQVLALVRNDAAAETVSKLGAEAYHGDLEDTERLRAGAKTADGVIHIAFATNFDDFMKACMVDLAAIEAMAEGLGGTGKPFVSTNGTLITVKGQLATEDMAVDRSMVPMSQRMRSEDLVYDLSAKKAIRGSVIRLSPTVHGPGDIGFGVAMINAAKKNGFVTYVGDGSARWPAVHVLDVAVLYCLALEKGRAGATYHAVSEQGIARKEMAELIGRKLQLPMKSTSLEDAISTLGFFAHVMNMDNFVSSEKTQEELGWQPTHPGILLDMEANYFAEDMMSKY